MTKDEILEFINKDDLIKEYLTLVKNYNDNKNTYNKDMYNTDALLILYMKDFISFTNNRNILKERTKEDLIRAISILRHKLVKESKEEENTENNITANDNMKESNNTTISGYFNKLNIKEN